MKTIFEIEDVQLQCLTRNETMKSEIPVSSVSNSRGRYSSIDSQMFPLPTFQESGNSSPVFLQASLKQPTTYHSAIPLFKRFLSFYFTKHTIDLIL